MQSMAIQYTPHYYAFSPSPQRDLSFIHNCKVKPSPTAVLPDRRQSYNTLGFQTAKLLGPPARFEASKLKVVFMGDESDRSTRIMPRTYTLSHCDFTANLTLTISNIINRDQLKGWYNKDDVLAEWTRVNGNLFLDVHCYVSGPNRFLDLAAEFRYYIFSKELPLVLEAVLYGDSDLFREHQKLMDAVVRVFFHSTSKKYNHVECWGPLKDAARGRGDKTNGFLSASKESSGASKTSGIRNSKSYLTSICCLPSLILCNTSRQDKHLKEIHQPHLNPNSQCLVQTRIVFKVN